MKVVIILSITVIFFMLFCAIKFPKVKIFNHEIQTFWIMPLLGAIIIVLSGLLSLDKAIDGLLSNDSINPIKIIVLFFSMTFMSIVLDELGFFEYLANFALKYANGKQIVLFVVLYFLTSFLTIFTSNDIIVLTFTPFIVFFTKNAKINPIPYLVGEFVAANTWSMIFIIGNPTNIYLATSANITFIDYFSIMVLPTIFAGVTAFLMICFIFKKEFKKQLEITQNEVKIKDKILLVSGVSILGGCTIFLVISSYIKVEMYLIALIFAGLLLVILCINKIINKIKKVSGNDYLINSIKRVPWSLAHFVISMFIIVLTLTEYGVTSKISNILNNDYPIITYGITSTLSCNLINNIPMSVLYSKIIPLDNFKALYSTIIGSNIGAFLSPIGALAGIMWISILKEHSIDYGFARFLKYGIMIVIPTLFMALLGLSIIL